MLLPITQNALHKLELLYRDLGFKIRYEKGSFRTGTCVFQSGKVLVINKFLSLEGKINALVEVLVEMNFDTEELQRLEEKQKELLLKIKQKSLEI